MYHFPLLITQRWGFFYIKPSSRVFIWEFFLKKKNKKSFWRQGQVPWRAQGFLLSKKRRLLVLEFFLLKMRRLGSKIFPSKKVNSSAYDFFYGKSPYPLALEIFSMTKITDPWGPEIFSIEKNRDPMDIDIFLWQKPRSPGSRNCFHGKTLRTLDSQIFFYGKTAIPDL